MQRWKTQRALQNPAVLLERGLIHMEEFWKGKKHGIEGVVRLELVNTNLLEGKIEINLDYGITEV